jgi:pimeloyl-ACP methyl ester carboxylesterase
MPQIELAFREYGKGAKTVVILHGLLGSSQSWQRAAKTLGGKYRVFALDQRNHGESPHTPEHSFAALRDDIEGFFEQHDLDQAYLLGHSMGGMAAMEFAFHYPERLQGLIIEDIAPRPYHSSSAGILEALAALPIERFTTRRQVEAELAQSISSPITRQFVLTNLVRKDDNSFGWRVNLPALQAFQAEMAAYEALPQARFEGETLFLGGANSDYHLDHDYPLMLSHFPNSRLIMIPNAGHWIHFEAGEAFLEAVMRFVDHGLMGMR